MTSKHPHILGIVLFFLIAYLISGCSTFDNIREIPLLPISESTSSEKTNIRQTASESEVDVWYNKYIEKQSPYGRLFVLEYSVIKPLYDSLPEKGHPRKKLLKQFLQEYCKQVAVIADNSELQNYSRSWLPARGVDDSAIINSLDNIVMSYQLINLAGIYLTSAGVFEKETQKENVYYSVLDRSVKEMSNELKQRLFFGKPEEKDIFKNELRLRYTRDLVTDIRLTLPKVMPIKNVVYRKLDRFFKELGRVNNVQKAKKMLNSSDFVYAEKILNEMQPIYSGEIDGFEDEINLEIQTKYYLGMTRVLLSGLR